VPGPERAVDEAPAELATVVQPEPELAGEAVPVEAGRLDLGEADVAVVVRSRQQLVLAPAQELADALVGDGGLESSASCATWTSWLPGPRITAVIPGPRTTSSRSRRISTSYVLVESDLGLALRITHNGSSTTASVGHRASGPRACR